VDLESFERAVAARRAVPEAQRAAADYLDAMARLGWAYMTRVRRLSLDPAYTPPETRQFIPETNATILLDQRLTAGAKNLAVRLVADAGQGHFVEVYTAHLAEEAGCSQRTIQRQIRELMEYSYIHAMKPNARGQTPIHISHRLRDVPEMGRFEKAVRVAPKLLALNDKQGLKETKLEQIMWPPRLLPLPAGHRAGRHAPASPGCLQGPGSDLFGCGTDDIGVVMLPPSL
jgi:hypothetical protein